MFVDRRHSHCKYGVISLPIFFFIKAEHTCNSKRVEANSK